MDKEIFKNIAERQVQGLMFHSEMADYYNFINLKGLKEFHECQFIEECETFRKIKSYFTDNYHETLRIETLEPTIIVIPIDWDNKTSLDIDETTIKTLTKKSLELYLTWETETLHYYQSQADTLFEQECYDSYCFVRHLIDAVELEKSHIVSLMLDLQTVGYDVKSIKGFQYKIKHK